MGTLFHQKPRNYRHVTVELEAFLKIAIRLSEDLGVSLSDVIEAKKVLEMERQNNLYTDNGDAFDEQVSGLGQIIQDLASSVENLSSERLK